MWQTQSICFARSRPPAYDLDLKRIVVIGHSAGGQLALWDAARPHLARTSPLYTPDPLPVSAVISLAGIDDLKSYRDTGPAACGGPQTIDSLVGHDGRNSYSDTSPANLLPIGVRQVIVSGALDPIVPEKFGRAYAEKAKVAGDQITAITIPNAGHFELIDPQSDAAREIRTALDDLEKQSPPHQ